MKLEDLGKVLKEVLEEMSVTGGGASFTPGTGEQYATPRAFSKKGQKTNAAIKTAEKFGYTRVERPKHPSHTKLVDYLEENKPQS